MKSPKFARWIKESKMKQLVYITSSGHSGSTLLDRLLGVHKDIFATGEIHRFSLGLHRDELPFRCDCGEAVPYCSFWQEVIQRLQSQYPSSDTDWSEQFQTTDHSVLKMESGEKYLNAHIRYNFLPTDIGKYVTTLVPESLIGAAKALGLTGAYLGYGENSHKLFAAISDISGQSTILDSTKNSVRMRSLYLTSPVPMKIIYLRRNGRAVANSRMKRTDANMETAAKIWVMENRKIQMTLKRMKNANILTVDYEGLCKNPKEEIARILDFLDLSSTANTQTETSIRHAIGGNPSRFNSLKIKLDEVWKTALTPAQIQTFASIAGSFEDRYMKPIDGGAFRWT